MALDSAADILPHNRGRDVLVTASYIGVLPARLVHDHLPRAVIGFDGGVGPQGANIAGRDTSIVSLRTVESSISDL
jgi:hypothetical protein